MNKWWLTTGTAVLLLLVVCAADAKKKWKADEDFAFEEVRTYLLTVCHYTYSFTDDNVQEM